MTREREREEMKRLKEKRKMTGVVVVVVVVLVVMMSRACMSKIRGLNRKTFFTKQDKTIIERSLIIRKKEWKGKHKKEGFGRRMKIFYIFFNVFDNIENDKTKKLWKTGKFSFFFPGGGKQENFSFFLFYVFQRCRHHRRRLVCYI